MESIETIFDRHAPAIRRAAYEARRLAAEAEALAVLRRKEWQELHRFTSEAMNDEMYGKLLPLRLACDSLGDALRYLEMGEHALRRLERDRLANI